MRLVVKSLQKAWWAKVLTSSPKINPPGMTTVPSVSSQALPADGDGEEVEVANKDTKYKRDYKSQYWRGRTNLERIIAAVIVVLFIIGTIFILINIISEAALLLDKMDTRTSPCDDFYQFACGNFPNILPSGYDLFNRLMSLQDEVNVIVKKHLENPSCSNDSRSVCSIKKFYSSCVNSTAVDDGDVATLKGMMSNYGTSGWPVLSDNWNASSFDLERTLAVLLAHQVQPFFYVEPDKENNSTYLLKLRPAEVFMSTVYRVTPPDQRLMAVYRNFILKVMRLFGATYERAKIDAEDMIAFETKLANLIQRNYDDKENVKMTQLEEIVPGINWTRMFTDAFGMVDFPNEKLELRVMIHSKQYLNRLLNYTATSPSRTVANYLMWRFIYKYMPYLGVRFRHIFNDFESEISDSSNEQASLPRWMECLQLINEDFEMVLAALYVKHEFNNRIEEEVRNMTSSMKVAIKGTIPDQTWMTDNMRYECLNEMDSMGEHMGFPAFILDPVQLDREYDRLEIADDHFLINIAKMAKYEIINDWLETKKEKNLPLLVNAMYNVAENKLEFPVGMLRPPLFSLERPNCTTRSMEGLILILTKGPSLIVPSRYLNYGALGTIIGHEMAHGLERCGSEYVKKKDWWSEEALKTFTNLTKCFVDQYSAYPLEPIGKNINGEKTLRENICDFAGLQQAYKAYKQYIKLNGDEPHLPGVNYTNEQVFFVQYAQVWCEVLNTEGYKNYWKYNYTPGRYRVTGVLQNTPSFSEVFSCPLGSAMNPEKKCNVWG